MKLLKLIQIITAIVTIVFGVLYIMSINADWSPAFETTVKIVALVSALGNSAILMATTYSKK